MNDDCSVTAPAPDGWSVLDTERTTTGVRYYRLNDGKLEWADYAFPLSLTVGSLVPSDTPVIATTALPAGKVGESYSYILVASGGSTPYTWTATGLPTGLVFSPAGILAGTPTVATTTKVTFNVLDGTGKSASITLSLVVTSTITEKLRVLVLYNSTGLESYSEAQREIMSSAKSGSLRAFCTSNCVLDESGKPSFRIWPQNITADMVPDEWKALVTAGNGKDGIAYQAGSGGTAFFVAMPADNTAAIAAIQSAVGGKTQLHVINDSNYESFLTTEHGRGYIKSDKQSGLQKFRDVFPIIPRSQWKALTTEGQGTFLSDLVKTAGIPAKDQDGLGYCWVYASVSTVETVRALQGQPFVSLSPESVGGPITGWRNRGGNGLDALEQLQKVGCCRTSFMNATNSLASKRWGSGWEADRANHKITNAWATIDDGDFDAVFTAVLLRLPVSIGLDWWTHQVQVTDPYVFSDGTYGVVFRNSWGEDWPSTGASGWSTLTESKSTPSGSFACISVTPSDKDLKQRDIVSVVRDRQLAVQKRIAQLKASYATAN